MPSTCLKLWQKLQLPHHVHTMGWDVAHHPETSPSKLKVVFFHMTFLLQRKFFKREKRTPTEFKSSVRQKEQRALAKGCWALDSSLSESKLFQCRMKSFQIWKGKKKRNWTLANSGHPGSSGWAHTLFPETWGQWLSVLSNAVLLLPREKTLNCPEAKDVQSCAPDCHSSRNASCVQHRGCDCRTYCTALPRLCCHLIWITGNFRETVILMSARDLPGDNSLLQLFSLPWIRQKRLRLADQPYKKNSHQGQACSTFWKSSVGALGAHLHGMDLEKLK